MIFLSNDIFIMSSTRFIAFIFFIALIISFIVLVVLLVIHNGNIDRFRRLVLSGRNNVRIYSIHYNENKVVVIDKHNLKEKKVHDLNWLYEGVSQSDQLRLKVWLTELKKENHKAPHNIELHVYIKNFKTSIFSILEVNSIDYEKGIIHLESHLFPNINKVRKDKNTKIFIKNEDAMQSILTEHNKNFVAVYNIRLFSTYEFNSKKTFRADHLIVTQIVNRLVKYLSDTRYLTLLKSNEIVITDFSILNNNTSIALGHTFSKEISKILLLNALQNQFSYKIGVVLDKTHTKSFIELEKTAREMSIFAQDNDIQSPVILYDSALNYHQLSQNTIVDNIKYSIEKNELATKFIPIVSGKENGSIFGYNVEFIPKRSLLPSFQDVQEYAYTNEIGLSLLELMLQNAQNVCKNQYGIVQSKKLLINILIPYYKLILDIKNNPLTSSLLNNAIFVLQDNDITSFSQDGSNIVEILSSLKEANVEIALSFTSSSLNLSTEVLSKFDYFIIDENNFNNILSSSKHQILFQDLLGNLFAYESKIITINIMSMQSLEYLIKEGINYYSSDILGFAYNELPSIEEKKLAKSLDIFNTRIGK